MTKNGKIVAVDPQSATETEVKIKGVAWSGMEKLSMIPDGLWGTESPIQGVQATTVVRCCFCMASFQDICTHRLTLALFLLCLSYAFP